MGRADMNVFLEACGPGGPFRLDVEGPGASTEGVRVLDQPFAVVGRGSGPDVALDHPDVSGRHAYLQRISGRVFCIDVGSRTGVHWSSGPAVMGWVSRERGVRIGPFRLRPGRGEGDEETRSGPPDHPPTSRSFGTEGLADGVLEFPDAKTDPGAWRISRALVLCGSSPLCKLRFPSPDVANVHCSLVRTPQGVWVVDLYGEGHTRVNGRAVGVARLDDGDELGVGRHRILFRRAAALGAAGPATSASSKTLALLPRGSPRGSAPADPPFALTVAPNRNVSTVAGTSDELAASLFNELSRTREQMGEQFRDSLMMVLQMFGSMHQEQASLIREELSQIRLLLERGSPLPAESPPALRLVRASDPPAPSRPDPPGLTVSHPADDPAAVVAPGASSEGTPDATPTAPSKTPEEVHARLVARLLSLQGEQAGRWQGLLDAVLGKKA